jgi:hypothetical protein
MPISNSGISSTAIDVLQQYGAAGNGSRVSNTGTDDTAAINSALTAANAAGNGVVLLQPGLVYKHSGVINIPANVTLWGYGAELRATDSTNQQVMLNGDNISVLGLKLSSYNSGAKGAPHKLQTVGTSQIKNLTIRDVEVSGAIDMGMLIGNVDGLLIMGCSIHDTNTDGIHLTRGCKNFAIIGNRVWNTGDDNIAVVSNQSNGAYCTDGVIANNVCEGNRTLLGDGTTANTAGRNIAVAGGKDIIISSNVCSGSNQAAIMVCSDTNGTTYGCNDISVLGNKVRGSNAQGISGHADILVTSIIGASMPVVGTVVRGNKLRDNVAGNGIQVGSGTSKTTIDSNDIMRPAARGIYAGGTAADVKIRGNDVLTPATDGIYIDTAVTGRIIINGNTVEAANASSAGTAYGLEVTAAAGITSMTAHDNTVIAGTSLTLDFSFETALAINDVRSNRKVA